MAQPKLQAEFFVRPDGTILPKAPPLKWKHRNQIFDRDKAKCKKCGRDVVRFGNTCSPWQPTPGAVDHIIPRARGGQNEDSNLRLLCITCNAQKGAK